MIALEFSQILQKEMPLPVLGFARQRVQNRYFYRIGLDASSVPHADPEGIAISFELSVHATKEQLLIAMDMARA